MIPRHANELLSRLEQVIDIGSTQIRFQELRLWYGKERITIAIWRDIQSKWEELQEDWDEKERSPLFVGEAEGVYTFIWAKGLSASDDAWFQEVRKMLRPPENEQQAAA